MRDLEARLAYYKIIINSNYGNSYFWDQSLLSDIYDEIFQVRNKIRVLKNRKYKIKRLFHD